jgi:hypothetical protein
MCSNQLIQHFQVEVSDPAICEILSCTQQVDKYFQQTVVHIVTSVEKTSPTTRLIVHCRTLAFALTFDFTAPHGISSSFPKFRTGCTGQR